jgi:hypothetical protein
MFTIIAYCVFSGLRTDYKNELGKTLQATQIHVLSKAWLKYMI